MKTAAGISHSSHQLSPNNIFMLSLNMGLQSKIGVEVKDTEIETALGWEETELKGFGISREDTVCVCVSLYIYIYIDIYSSMRGTESSTL